MIRFLHCGFGIDTILLLKDGATDEDLQKAIDKTREKYEEDYCLDDVISELPENIEVICDYAQLQQGVYVYY